MLRIGLTGGIATGKSIATNYLYSRFQVPIIDADQVARDITVPGMPAYRILVKKFGEQILRGDSAIDRKRLGELVFHDHKLLRQLNLMLHPPIIAEVENQLRNLEREGVRVVVVCAALILELRLQKQFNELIVILSERTVQEKRLVDYRQIPANYAEAIINSQYSNEKRLSFDNAFHVWNNGPVEEFQNQLDQVWSQVLERHNMHA